MHVASQAVIATSNGNATDCLARAVGLHGGEDTPAQAGHARHTFRGCSGCASDGYLVGAQDFHAALGCAGASPFSSRKKRSVTSTLTSFTVSPVIAWTRLIMLRRTASATCGMFTPYRTMIFKSTTASRCPTSTFTP